MQDRTTYSSQQIEHATSASICQAVGERLRQNIRPETAALPARLQRLLDEMQKQDMTRSIRQDQA